MIPLLTTTSTVMCPHGGQATLITTNTEALVDGVPVLLKTDQHPVVGCPFMVGITPMPCVLIRWSTAATQTKIREVPVLHQASVGQCVNAVQAPQGVAVVVQTQQRAKGL